MAREAVAPDATATPRAVQRRKTFIPVSVEIGDQTHRAHVLNLSAGGACLHARCPLRVWNGVAIDLGGQVLRGRISWVAGERCGVRFLQPLTVEQVDAIVG